MASRFPFVAPRFLSHISSCAPYHRLRSYVFHPLVDSLPPVLRLSRRLVFVSMFPDGLLLYSQSPMYLKRLARLVADYRSFPPRLSLSRLCVPIV